MSWSVFKTDLHETHVVPNDDEMPHSHTVMCWCWPKLEAGIFVHNSADRREHTVKKQ